MGNLLKIFVLIAVLAVPFAAQDLKPEDVIAKHLNAIGKKELRDSIKTLIAAGASEFESRTPVIKGGGKAIVVSDASNLYFVLGLNSKEYPAEKVGYFNGKASLPFIAAGNRSLLGMFLNEHAKMLSDGLFVGGMSLTWILNDPEHRKARFKSAGTKKIDGKKLYAIEYSPANGGSSEFSVRLFFDESFNHVRTEYKREIQTKQGTFGQANQQASAKMDLTEVFSDFRTVDGITLPYVYRVTFVSNSNQMVNENSWGIRVNQYYFNQQLAPDFFTFDVK